MNRCQINLIKYLKKKNLLFKKKLIQFSFIFEKGEKKLNRNEFRKIKERFLSGGKSKPLNKKLLANSSSSKR